MISLKKYQADSKEALLRAVSELLGVSAERRVCVFQSPTGSGKTVIVAKVIEELIKELPQLDMCFLWVSIGKGDLHKQSHKSLVSIFGGFPSCVLIEDEFFGSRTIIEQNEVVVVNWEKLRSKDHATGEWKSKIMRTGEGEDFVEVLQSTKEQRRIILIIDESHYASDTDRTNELRQIVNADVTLEMSATPKLIPTPQEIVRGTAKYKIVEPKDVIEQGMIKKEITINEGVAALVADEKTSQDIILEAAYIKRLQLKEAFNALGVVINPLCIIQLPNAESGQAKRDVVEAYLASRGVTEANGKLAVWLSEEKTEMLDEIRQNDNTAEFLIFKQAVDTGWDCPRAHILVKLREIQSYTFEVQTVGRILRMPEQKHYETELLNRGYIFTNLESIVVKKEEYNPNIIKHLRAVRKEGYNELDLPSYYKSRVDYGDITSTFYKVLESVFCEGLGIARGTEFTNVAKNAESLEKQGMVVAAKVYLDGLVADQTFSTAELDTLNGELSEPHVSVDARLSDSDIFDVFNLVIKANLNGFAPRRSIPTVREAIYLWFRNYLGINPRSENGATTIQMLFLHARNRKAFVRLLSQATGEYKPLKTDEVRGRIAESVAPWNVTKDAYFNQYADEKVNHVLYLYDPCYLAVSRSGPERDFESHLDSMNDRIAWWYKNGEGAREFFGIKYTEGQDEHTFYPDYLMQYKSGILGIFDTKKGKTATEAAPKAAALQSFLKAESKSGRKLQGGIVVKDHTGQWRINRKDNYSYDPNDLREWDFFDTLI